MEYPITYHGEETGRISIEPDGLYYRLSARCDDPGHGIWRLWGCFGFESRCLGVCIPVDGGLWLEKRISRRSWPDLPAFFVLGREHEGFLPWQGIVEEQLIPDAMLWENADGARSLAIFTPPEGPVPLAEYVSQMREEELDGRPCLLLELPLEALKAEN
ncbi:MAG: hypothetical protein IIY94_09310 [Oscillospiraceae bacterium]|nr:hypothetical protein [Oscillospiraceae bacterium]